MAEAILLASGERYNATVAIMSQDSRRRAPAVGSLGFILVALVVLCTVLGYFLDRWLGTTPWLMVAGVFVGGGLGFTYVVLVFLAGSRGEEKGKRGENEDSGPR
jgi:F0F1-type ATP synthase assembly protein I